MKDRSIRPLWVFLIVLAAFPLTGLVCSFAYHDASMFYWSFAFAGMAAIVLPVVLVLARVVPPMLVAGVASFVLAVQKLLRRGR